MTRLELHIDATRDARARGIASSLRVDDVGRARSRRARRNALARDGVSDDDASRV